MNPRPYDILPDGRVVVVNPVTNEGGQRPGQIHVVMNWFQELRTKLPAAK